MRVESATVAKGKRRVSTQLEPSEGTVLRSLWQRFKDNPAQPVFVNDITGGAYHGSELEQLRNFYGMDIRPFGEKRSHDGVGRARVRYWLVGEWFGRTYRDYVAERRAQEERAGAKNEEWIPGDL